MWQAGKKKSLAKLFHAREETNSLARASSSLVLAGLVFVLMPGKRRGRLRHVL